MTNKQARKEERQAILASIEQLKAMRANNPSIVSALEFLEDVIEQRGK